MTLGPSSKGRSCDWVGFAGSDYLGIFCRVKQSHVWGWLDPSQNSDLMAVTYLKGAGAAIGRGAEAFEAQQGQHAESASNLEAAMQTSRYSL